VQAMSVYRQYMRFRRENSHIVISRAAAAPFKYHGRLAACAPSKVAPVPTPMPVPEPAACSGGRGWAFGSVGHIRGQGMRGLAVSGAALPSLRAWRRAKAGAAKPKWCPARSTWLRRRNHWPAKVELLSGHRARAACCPGRRAKLVGSRARIHAGLQVLALWLKVSLKDVQDLGVDLIRRVVLQSLNFV